ncbi:MAG: hypothetical protein LBU10_01185 [Endomicrobium sp.]|jgi:hypothetical protein|nr:hypothetical protein [Endomicrobium sp.]
MARMRIIKPEFFDDVKVAKLVFRERLFYIALWLLSDDEGYLKNDCRWLKIKCFPYDDEINEKTIRCFVNKLVSRKFIVIKNGIINIPNFLKHQRVSHPTPSKLVEIFEKACDPCEDQETGKFSRECISKALEG